MLQYRTSEMNSGIFLGLFVTLWALLALTDAQDIQLEPGKIGSGVAGIVRVLHNDEWGTVCDDGFDMNDAKVACRQLGFTKAVGYWGSGQGTGKIWLDNMACSGAESSLHKCKHDEWGKHDCSQTEAVGVVCSGYKGEYVPQDNIQFEPGTTGLAVAGVVRVYHTSQWGTVCHISWNTLDAKVACRQLNFTKAFGPMYNGRGSGKVWLDNMRCHSKDISLHSCSHNGWGSVDSSCNSHTKDAGVVCSGYKDKTDINVMFSLDEKTNGSGVVKAHVEYYDVTGNVCANNFKMNDARVLCRHFGYNEAENLSPWIKQSQINFAISMNCNGKESSPNECRDFSIRQVVNCDNGDIVGLVCRNQSGPTKLTSDDITLVNGSSKGEGRIQIKRNGMNGTICSDGWDMIDANVLCRMKGFAGAITAYKTFGKGSGPVWFTGMSCKGKEDNIEHCKSEKTTKCSHRRDAGVVCYSDRDITGQLEVELASTDHDSSHYGRVQIIFNNTLRTICGDGDWDINDAHVVCRMLNYKRALAATRQYGKPTTGPSLSNVRCKGHEKSLDECDHRGWDHLICSEGFDAGVICEKIIDEAPYILVDVIKDITENTARIVFGRKRQYKKRIFQIAVEQITSKKRLSSNDFRQESFEFLPVNATTSKAIGNDSYMAAEIVNPNNFTIGDGRYYNGYYNAPLEPQKDYRVHVRAITIRHGNKVYGKSSYVAFKTKSEYPKASPIIEAESDGSDTIVGLSMIIVILIGVIIGMSVSYVLKKRKEKQSTEANMQALEMENAGNLRTSKDNAHGNTKASNQEENEYHVIVDQDDERRALRA